MPFEIDAQVLFLISAGAALATLLRAFTGFGFALVAVPVFSLILSPSQVVVLTSSLALLLGVMSMRGWRGHLDGNEVTLLLVPAAVGTAIGASVLPYLSIQLFQMAAGIAVLLSCATLLVRRVREPHTNRLVTGVVGLLSGLMNGALAIPGPPMIAYALLTKSDPSESRALLTAFFTVSAFFALATFTASGRVNGETVLFAVAAIPALLAANWTGNKLFTRYGGRLYRTVASWALVLMGVTIIYRAI